MHFTNRETFLKSFKIIRIIIYLAIVTLIYFMPIKESQTWTICIFQNVFGIRCIGCGMTRAFSTMMHFNFNEAMQLNSLVLAIFPAAIIIIFNEVYSLIVKKHSLVDKLILKIYK